MAGSVVDFFDRITRGLVPRVATQEPELIVSAVTPGTTYVGSSVINVFEAREITLLIDFDGAAADDIISIIPMFSCQKAVPLITDDVWFVPAVDDGSVTGAEPGGTQLASVDFTLAPEFGQRKLRPLEIRLENANNATDEYRLAVNLRCTYATHFACIVRNTRAAAGTLNVWAVRTS